MWVQTDKIFNSGVRHGEINEPILHVEAEECDWKHNPENFVIDL